MPPNRNQARTWFVEFQLAARGEDGVTPSDTEVRSLIKDIVDLSNSCRRIRSLQRVSFAYTFSDPTQPALAEHQATFVAGNQATFVNVIGFAHSSESLRETAVHSWIQDPRVLHQPWTPVSVTPGAGSNWMQQDIIKSFFADCECGRRVRVDWLWTGDLSVPINKGGRPNRRHPGANRSEMSPPPPETDGVFPPPPPQPSPCVADLALVRSPPESLTS